ncbi:MAG: YfcE family phosphodiesterase, partial [Eubacteriales bacterium]
MRILIVSDTHRRDEMYIDLVKQLQPIDHVIHCGDTEGSEDYIRSAVSCPVDIVRGNNDFFSDLPREIETTIGKYKIWITHGNHYFVTVNSEWIKEEARSRNVDIVMYGHTHMPVV